jgi:voltage-gated potassium channel
MTDGELKQALEHERYEVLAQLEDWLQLPVLLLGFVWLVLLVVELIWGLNAFLTGIVYLIWGVFLVDFIVRMILAPDKLGYLRTNWLTALSLFVPALRIFSVFRIFRALRLLSAARGVRLLRVVSSLNRGMRGLRLSMKRRRFGYVISLSTLVVLVAAAAMLAFESDQPGGFINYADALYWTAMMMTTLGSGYWPQSVEGRAMAFLLALYAFTMLGYVTATLATYFVGRDAVEPQGEVAGAQAIEALRLEVEAMRREIRDLRQNNPGSSGG